MIIRKQPTAWHRGGFITQDKHVADHWAKAGEPLTPLFELDDGQFTHRHVKRGSLYNLIGEGKLQMNEADGNLSDNYPMTLYQGADGQLWARPTDEFNDGRFERLERDEANKPGRDIWERVIENAAITRSARLAALNECLEIAKAERDSDFPDVRTIRDKIEKLISQVGGEDAQE